MLSLFWATVYTLDITWLHDGVTPVDYRVVQKVTPTPLVKILQFFESCPVLALRPITLIISRPYFSSCHFIKSVSG